MLKPGTIVIALFLTVTGLFYGSQDSSSVSAEPGTSETPVDARALFSKHCVVCHGNDGRAKTSKGKRTQARNLADPEWQDKVSDERIFNSISYGQGTNMPKFNKKLSAAQIEALVSYVRQFRR